MHPLTTITSLLAASFLAGLTTVNAAPKPKAATNAVTKRLTVDRIFHKKEFNSKGYSLSWLPGNRGYTRLESAKGGGNNIVRYRTGSKTGKVIVTAEDFTPAGSDTPLSVQGYTFSKGQGMVLIYTKSRRVWRSNTRGDYWLLNLGSRELRQLGGDAPPACAIGPRRDRRADNAGSGHDREALPVRQHAPV